MTTTLQTFFQDNPKTALAFSGGTDSAYLLSAGLKYGADIRAYYIKSQFQPAFELADAQRLAAELGTALTILPLDVLSVPQVRRNPADRCYYCKQAIFTTLIRQAGKDGYPLVIDGTNVSDLTEDRPGMRVLAELGVRSPLREAGLTKEGIRVLSKEQGLFTWNKPAYACLSTRIAPGEEITEKALRQVEEAEKALAACGFSDFRVRVAGNSARLQVTASQMDLVLAKRSRILELLHPYYTTVTLDLKERQGAAEK